jgi:hypothetical protein
VKKLLNTNEEYNYSDWLLRPSKANDLILDQEIKSNSVVLRKCESFEDVSSNQGGFSLYSLFNIFCNRSKIFIIQT